MGGSDRSPRTALLHSAFLHASEEAHAETAAEFVGTGLRDDKRTLLITTPLAWQKIAPRLGDAAVHNRLTVLDPIKLLELNMLDGLLDRAGYVAQLQSLLGDQFPPQRMFGDAAGMLAGNGNLPAALALEQSCSELTTGHGVQIMCGHDLRRFAEPDRDWQIRSVINAHGHSTTHAGVRPGVVPPHVARSTNGTAELILLWDDYADSRLMYAEALTFGGYRVITADDVAGALKLWKAYDPDLIVLDVRLPSSMAATTPHALTREQLSRVPVLALTAHAFKAERDSIASEGFAAVLSKPCLPDALVGAVTNALRQRARF